MNYQQHPLSAAFPPMTPEEFQSLKDSVNENGVLNPITIYEGMVLDGWHRYQAALELGMECPEAELDDWIDPKEFVLAQNKNRRHITASQLAMATTAVYEWYPSHRPNKGAGPAHLSKTSEELAEIAGTSKRTINQAKSVLRNASPEVQEAVKSGKIGLEKAQKISKLPKDEQAAAIDKPIIAPERPRLTEDYGPDEAELKANELAHAS
jgi:ParB-like chromosome segregation protein Spo0J